MRIALKILRWFGIVLGIVIAVLMAGFGLIQTPPGKAWLAHLVAGAISDPESRVSIENLRGLVPFDMTAERISFADRDGVYLRLREVRVELSAAGLLAGRAHFPQLTIADAEMARRSTSPGSFTDYLTAPQLPLAVAIDRIAIDRLALGPSVLGEPVVASAGGRLALRDGRALVLIDLRRTDGAAGDLRLDLDIAGAAEPVLALDLQVSEPSGLLLDRALGRADRLPFSLSLKGKGPLADWHGRLTAAAGAQTHVDAELDLAQKAETAVEFSGEAALLPLLPPAYAALVGDRLRFSLHGSIGDGIVLDRFSLNAAAGSLSGDATLAGSEIAAALHAEIPDLARLQGLLGESIGGSAALDMTLKGARDRPAIEARFAADEVRLAGSGAKRIAAAIAAHPESGDKVSVSGSGRVEGLSPPAGVNMPEALGRDIDWSFAALTTPSNGSAELTRLKIAGAGLDINASGQVAEGGRSLIGKADVAVADLRPFSALAGRPIAGAVKLTLDAERQGESGFALTAAGSGNSIATGIPAADALLGGAFTLDGAMRRDNAGVFVLDRLNLTAGDLSAGASGRFDPAGNRLTAAGDVELPRLQALGPAVGVDLGGALSARIEASGPPDRLRLDARIDGRQLAVADARIERLRLAAEIPDLAAPKLSAEGKFRGGGVEGAMSFAGERIGSAIEITQMRLNAAGGSLDGNLRADLDTGLASGSLAARIPDLSRWSGLAGTPLAGSVEMRLGLDARGGGQGLELTANGRGLEFGDGSSRPAVGRFDVKASLADLWRSPTGSGRVSLSGVSAGAAQLSTADLSFSGTRPGHFGFRGEASGKPLSASFAGEAGIANDSAELRLDRFAGTLDATPLRLDRPLTLSRRGNELAFSGLALRFGRGLIAGNGAVRGETLSLAVRGDGLSLADAARLAGANPMHGALSFSLHADGTLAAPRGRLSADLRDFGLGVAAKGKQSLGLSATANWNGRSLDTQGRVTGLPGDRIAFTASAPLVLSRTPLSLSAPPQGRLAMRIEGGGSLDHFADLLPLGEDRLSGKFAIDLTVGGTVGNPEAGGRITLSHARYLNFGTGAVLTGMQATILGNRDRLTLTSLTAGDGASGKLSAQGTVALTGRSAPSLDLSARLDGFRLAARDEAVVSASGRVRVTGPLTSPTVNAPLTIDRAEITLPERLPPNVVVLNVVEVNGRSGKPLTPAALQPAAPAFTATLNITIDMPGRVFVRGHGLDSEWRGRLAIAGTSAAPRISGSLEAIRGSFDLLGKSFRLAQSRITFDGGAKLDPVLDIVAEVNAGGVTAQVKIGGFLSSPTVSLTSTPAMPQDEVLARVLFGRGVGQITAAEGLQLATAAAALTGRGPDVLGRLRSGLGLDWLSFGGGPVGVARSILNPNASGSATSGNAVSAGKYIAEGVSVGITQGVSPPTSKVTVEIQLTPRLTLQTEAGQNTGTGIGLNYNFDY
jgi:translocation and assembly module TamB